MWIGVLWAGLRATMWITHVGGKFRQGLLEKSLIIALRRAVGTHTQESVRFQASRNQQNLGHVSETPTHTTCLKSTAVHLQFVRQYAPHLYRHTFLASKLRRKGNPAIRLPFVRQFASHLYGSTPPICTAVLLEKYWGLGSPESF